MKKHSIKTTTLALLAMFAVQFVQAQYSFKIQDTVYTLLGTDSVQLPSPQEFRGTIKWQRSLDSTNWTTLKTSDVPDTFSFKATGHASYRMALGEESCDTIYSGTVNVGQAADLNELLAIGFTLEYINDFGIPLDSMLADSIPAADLTGLGYSLDTLYAHGATVDYMADSGVTLDSLLAAETLPLEDIYGAGFLVGTLEQAGVDSLDLVAAGLIGVVVDQDGRSNKWVKIGGQIWMAENLQVTHWRGGTIIPTIDATLDIRFGDDEYRRRQWPYNGDESLLGTYGRFYTHYTVMGDSLCPSGWHVPDTNDWDAMVEFLGGTSIAGGKLKTTSVLWNDPNEGATNSSGFNAEPAGIRRGQGDWWHSGNESYFYLIEHIDDGTNYQKAYRFRQTNMSDASSKNTTYQHTALPIRCIKD